MAELDWSYLRSFVSVARNGSLSAAARASGLSQPTLSRHIGELERQLSVILFDRQATGLALTATGTDLLQHAEAMADSAHRLSLAASGLSAVTKGTVRVTASEIVATYLLPPLLVALRIEHPSIEVEVLSSDQVGNLLRREADIALRMFRPSQSDVVTRHLGDMDICAFASREYLARRGSPSLPADMPDHDLIGFDTNDQIVRHFRGGGLPIDRESFTFRCDDQVVCWEMVLAGAGIGFMQRGLGDRHEHLVALFDGQALATMPVWLTAHAELRTSALIRCVYDFLAERFAVVMNTANTRTTRP